MSSNKNFNQICDMNFLQRNLYRKYRSSENFDEKYKAGLELLELNEEIVVKDENLYLELRRALVYNKSSVSGMELLYRIWFFLITETIFFKTYHIDSFIYQLAAEPPSLLREELMNKALICKIEQHLINKELDKAQELLYRLKTKAVFDSSLEKYSNRITELELRLK